MTKPKVFVDGQSGTTGLKIHDHLSKRDDLEVLFIDEDKRKDMDARREFINKSDIVFLCLPDSAAKESVSLIENDSTRVIDASTAHRTNPQWVYGFPELSSERRNKIKEAKRVCVPGCHASGFIALIYPLVKAGILPPDYPVTCTSVTGYSGGGKALIEKYQDENAGSYFNSPRHYGLKLDHKHLPEMQHFTELEHPPVFDPVLGNFYQGMAVSIPLVTRLLNKKPNAVDIHQVLSNHYYGEHFVKVMPFDNEAYLDELGHFNPELCNGTNTMEIFVFGHEEQAMLMARFDNLGKGASGAAIQNMNIMLGLEESIGLKAR